MFTRVNIFPTFTHPCFWFAGYGALMILTGVPVYLIFIAWKNKPQCVRNGLGKHNGFSISAVESRQHFSKMILFVKFLRPSQVKIFAFSWLIFKKCTLS